MAIPALADQVVLKNGDRLSGTVVKSDAKNLVIKTEYAGEVTVDWSAVQDMTSTKSFHVGLKSGQTVVGPLTVKEGKLEVTTKDFGALDTPADNIVVIRDDAGQLAYEKSLHPGFAEGWVGGVNVGFAATRGNSEAKNLNIAFNAVRTGLHDKLTLYTSSVYATNDLPAASPHTTANSTGGGARYDHDFSSRMFGFANGDFLSNAL
jgi:phage baseplate assembly protein gpV